MDGLRKLLRVRTLSTLVLLVQHGLFTEAITLDLNSVGRLVRDLAHTSQTSILLHHLGAYVNL